MWKYNTPGVAGTGDVSIEIDSPVHNEKEPGFHIIHILASKQSIFLSGRRLTLHKDRLFIVQRTNTRLKHNC